MTPLSIVVAVLKLAYAHLRTVAEVVAVATLLLFFNFKVNALRQEVSTWQYQAAKQAKTIEEQQGLFAKQAMTMADVRSVLNSKDAQLGELQSQIKKAKESLGAATTVAVKLRHALSGMATAKQVVVAAVPGKSAERFRVDFEKELGFLKTSGYTLTSPPEAFVKVDQLRPLKMTIALSQDKLGGWHTYTTVSEPDVQADILVSAVDQYLKRARWYDGIAIGGTVGAGSSGALLGASGTVEIGSWSLGPAAWLAVGSGVSKYYGGTVSWKPFK